MATCYKQGLWQTVGTATSADVNFTTANPYGLITGTGVDAIWINYKQTCCGQFSYGPGGTAFGYVSDYICQNQIAFYYPGHDYCTPTLENQWAYVRAEETPEQKAARAARTLAIEVADSRADQLLMSFLSDDQADQYKREQRFELTINGRQYRIKKGRSGNVQLIENGQPVARYCAHPEIWTPDGDTMLAQLLMLKTDEARFLKIANRTALT